LDEDTRLVPILNNLSQGFLAGIASEWTSASGSGSGDDIKAEMVNELAANHFPMCMRALHDNLQRDNHLKYFGRLQYGLFLKVSSTDIGHNLLANISFSGFGTVCRRSYYFLAKIL
jgi:DNA primase large subunit